MGFMFMATDLMIIVVLLVGSIIKIIVHGNMIPLNLITKLLELVLGHVFQIRLKNIVLLMQKCVMYFQELIFLYSVGVLIYKQQKLYEYV